LIEVFLLALRFTAWPELQDMDFPARDGSKSQDALTREIPSRRGTPPIPSDIEGGGREYEFDHLALSRQELDLIRDRAPQRSSSSPQTPQARRADFTADPIGSLSSVDSDGLPFAICVVDLPKKPARRTAEAKQSKRSKPPTPSKPQWPHTAQETRELGPEDIEAEVPPAPNEADYPWLRASSAFIVAQPTPDARSCAYSAARLQWKAAQSARADFLERELGQIWAGKGALDPAGIIADECHIVAPISMWEARMKRDFIALFTLVRSSQTKLPDMAIINLIRCLCDGPSMDTRGLRVSDAASMQAQERHRELVLAMSARIRIWLGAPAPLADPAPGGAGPGETPCASMVLGETGPGETPCARTSRAWTAFRPLAATSEC
jgi:hypothetical protein